MENKPVLVKDIIGEFRKYLVRQNGEKEVMQFVYLLFEAWEGWTKARVQLDKETSLTEESAIRFRIALEDLKKNRPIQYIIGETWFCGLKFKVTPDVLIPRPETEELVELAERDIRQAGYRNPAVLDIGTGSGCIAISLRKKFPSSTITAVDISVAALRIASENAALNDCNIQFIQADILNRKGWSDLSSYHIIIANPPYITEKEKSRMEKNVLDHEPGIALFVGVDDSLLFYKAIVDFAMDHLLPSGLIFFEVNENYAAETEDLLSAKGFKKVQVLQDIHGKPRFVRAYR